MKSLATFVLLALLAATVSCSAQSDEQASETTVPTTAPADPCSSVDETTVDASYVIVTEPGAGDTVGTPFTVRGCSRSYESTVTWTLTDAEGVTLGSGFSTGGGFDGGAQFEFDVIFDVPTPQVVHLEVVDAGGSDEGGPSPRTVLPLIVGS